MISPRVWGLLMVAMLAAKGGLAQADIYVSTAGNDANSGVQEQPIRTIEHARDCVRRQIKQGGATRVPITVWISAGDYSLEQTFAYCG